MTTHQSAKGNRPTFINLGRFLILLCMMAAATSCTSKEDDGSLLVFHGYQEDDVRTFDPADAYDSVSLEMVPMVHETLYEYAYLSDEYKVVPLLAADMPKYSSDRLTVTIPLKHGVKFADDPAFKETNGKGRELHAQDFVTEFKRLALPSIQSQGWWIFDGKLKGINAFHDKLINTSKGDIPKVFNETVEGIQALNDYTLQIKLNKPYPQLLYVLSMNFTSPIASEAITAYADETGKLNDHPIGTGPFVLKEWRRGSRLVFERNPGFHSDFYPSEGSPEYRKKGFLADSGKPLPFNDRLSIDVIKEQQPRWLKFMNGELDWLKLYENNFGQAIVNKTELSPELAAKGIRLNIESGVAFYYVSFNMKDKLVGGNKFLRQAISSAINREKWIDTFTSGTGIKQVTALPIGIPDRPKKSKIKYDYDLKAAKDLIKKAGYPEGRGLPVLNFDMRGADSRYRQLGDFFTQQLGAIGIKLNVIYNTFPAFLEKIKQGNHQITYGGWSMDYPDAENVFQILYGPNKSPGPNDSNFDHPEMNKYYDSMAILESGSKREAVVQKMDDILQEEVPWALGYYVTDYKLSQPWLLNYRGNELISNRTKFYRVNKDVKHRYQEAK